MAVNASPLYQKAEERYRRAQTPADKIAALEEMTRQVPKHKASEKLQAQIKQKLKAAREESQRGGGKGGAGHRDRDPFAVPKQGAGQIALLGEPNVGKSSIVGALTKAKVEIAEYPHSTHTAVPGMAHHENVPIQLVDMPPVADGHAEPGMVGAYRSADAILLVVDLAAIDLLDQYERPLALLAERGMRPAAAVSVEPGESEAPVAARPILAVGNKLDLAGAASNFDEMKDLCGGDVPMLAVSASTGQGLPEMLAALFDLLGVIRLYAKKPGKPADEVAPFILPRGGTVDDMARLVHRELAESLRHARVWGAGVHDGQQVHQSHVLSDKDIVELHF